MSVWFPPPKELVPKLLAMFNLLLSEPQVAIGLQEFKAWQRLSKTLRKLAAWYYQVGRVDHCPVPSLRLSDGQLALRDCRNPRADGKFVLC